MNPLIVAIYQQLLLQVDGNNEAERERNKSINSSSNNNNDDDNKSNQMIKKVKQDNSAFTIADGLVQRLLTKVLFSRVNFRSVVGEEEEEEYGDDKAEGGDDDNDDDDGDESSWSQVQGLEIPRELQPLVQSTKSEMESLALQYLSSESNDDDDESKSNKHNNNNNYEHLTVFIDPIDGTREFSSGKGEQCSVCIGFANEFGKAVAGVVYRPIPLSLSSPSTKYKYPTWVAGAKDEGYAVCDFGLEEEEGEEEGAVVSVSSSSGITSDGMIGGGLLTSNGSISPFVSSLIDELGFERVKSGGAGNKMMMLLQNSITGNKFDDVDTFNNGVDNGKSSSVLYIQDRGVSRWDTCAAEACLESYGGKLVKLTHFLDNMETSTTTTTTMKEEGGQQQQQQCNTNHPKEYYTYLASRTNLDFIPGSATLTKYNCRDAATINDGDMQPDPRAMSVEDVKPYSNLCGLVAVGREWNTVEGITKIEEAMRRAAGKNLPSFD